MKGNTMETLKAIGSIIGVIATIGFFWAAIWILCLANDACYYSNFGGL